MVDDENKKMMERKLKVAILLIPFFLLLTFILNADKKPDKKGQIIPTIENDCERKNQTFQSGEKVTYSVYYNLRSIWVRAGEVTFTVEDARLNGKDLLHLHAEGRTLRRYDWIFKVRDVYESYIDPETMLPHRFMRDVYEGGYTIFNDYKFDRKNNKVAIIHEDWKTPRYKDTLSITPCTQDVLSSIYYARTIEFDDYNVGDTIPFEMFLEEKVYEVFIRYQGRERIKTSEGRYDCIKFSALLLEGTIFSGGEDMSVWVTDDKNKIPVLVEAPILVGSIKAVLQDFEGLRHDPTSVRGGNRR